MRLCQQIDQLAMDFLGSTLFARILFSSYDIFNFLLSISFHFHCHVVGVEKDDLVLMVQSKAALHIIDVQ